MSHPEYSEYATCTVCGLKKYCRLMAGHFICFACEHDNFKGLKKINKDNQQ